MPLLSSWERRQAELLNPNLLFAGQYTGDESGLAYNRFPYYDPQSGNYLSSDPIGLNGGETPYAYVHNPMGWVDPFGLAKCPTLIRDSLGRIKNAEATVVRGALGKGTGVNKAAKEYMRKNLDALPGDDAGHILAKMFGGQGGKNNIFPQLMKKNRGEYRTFEKEIMERLKNGSGKLDLKWDFSYSGSSKRPDQIIYDVYENGKKVLTRTFDNI